MGSWLSASSSKFDCDLAQLQTPHLYSICIFYYSFVMEHYPRPEFVNLSRWMLSELLDDQTVGFEDFKKHEDDRGFPSGMARQTWNLLLKSERWHENDELFVPIEEDAEATEAEKESVARRIRTLNLVQTVVKSYADHEETPQFAPYVSFRRNIGRRRFDFIVSLTQEQVAQAESTETLPFNITEE
jgi:hypothetical protein